MRPPLFIAQPRSHSPANQGGFVLVAILMLIALSLVLIVTTSSISQMERKAVSNSTKDEIAKRNALFALEVAMAQLQKEAGPDQRVTATADIYNTNGTNVSQPYWTGVWKTFNPAWTNDPARQPWYRPQPLDIKMPGQSTPILRDWSTNPAPSSTNPNSVVWLVSGATNNLDINPFSFGANASTGGSNSVVVATGWGTNSNSISVPLVTINAPGTKISATNPVPGRYAYWVSDEGVKAKVTLPETNLTRMPITSVGIIVSGLVHFLGGSAPYLPSVMTNYGGVNISTDIRTNSSLPLITSLNGLSYVDPSYAGISNNALAADFTVWSYGVLCDVRRGGLKQDLTAAFESTKTNPNNFYQLQYRSGVQSGSLTNNDSFMVYQASALSLPISVSSYLPKAGTVIDGLRWQSLYNYYNYYKSTMPLSPSYTNSSTGPLGIGLPSTSSYNKLDARQPGWDEPSGTNISYSSLAPVVISDSIICTLKTVTTNISSTNYYNFVVQYYPMIVIHNPYSVGLKMNSSVFTITKNLGSGVTNTLTCGNYTNLGGPYADTNNNKNLWPGYLVTNTNTTTGVETVTFNSAIFQTTSGNPINISVTNDSSDIMSPGEIRVYGLGAPNKTPNSGVTALTNACVFNTNPLVSKKLLSIDPLVEYGGVSFLLTNYVFPTNSIDITNTTSTNNVNYNNIHYGSQKTFNSGQLTVSTWPSSKNPISNVDLPGSLRGTGTGTYPANTQYKSLDYLLSRPIILFSCTERLKGTVQSTRYTNYLGITNIVPVFLGNSIRLDGPFSSSAGSIVGANPVTETDTNLLFTNSISIKDNVINPNSSTVSWCFQSVGDALPIVEKNNSNNVVLVLRDIPIAPMTSLGQLMHLEETYNMGTGTTIFPVGIPGMSVGGSMCCPETGPSNNAMVVYHNFPSSQTNLFLDNSFLANEALFDTYFFSTVPPTNGFTWGTGLGGLGPFTLKLTSNSVATNQPLPNSRHVFYRKNGINPSVADLQDEGRASANLLINGPFNVNSTSVSAWKALLTSLNGQTFPIYNYISGEFENRYVTNPILRFWSVGRFNPNDPWDGMRSLTDRQVNSLAQEIVKQVRMRGPFLSMGDFLNRKLLSTNSMSTNNLMGALQSAIENTQTNGTTSDVNNNIHNASVSAKTTPFIPVLASGSPPTYPSTNTLISASIIATNSAMGIPGYLMQQDLVQAFAPVMTVRSDTFMIRVYGEADKKTTASVKNPIAEARVWGEAVVQRVPDFVDQSDPALNKPNVIKGINSSFGDATPLFGSNVTFINSINLSLGRRFRVVSFRWLNQTDL